MRHLIRSCHCFGALIEKVSDEKEIQKYYRMEVFEPIRSVCWRIPGRHFISAEMLRNVNTESRTFP